MLTTISSALAVATSALGGSFPGGGGTPLVVGAVAISVYVTWELLPTKILTTMACYPLTSSL